VRRGSRRAILPLIPAVAALSLLLAAEDTAKLATDAQQAFSQGKYDDAAIVYRTWAAAEPESGAGAGRSGSFAALRQQKGRGLRSAGRGAKGCSR